MSAVRRDQRRVVGRARSAAPPDADALLVELRRYGERVNLLFDACDRWLRDPEDPTPCDAARVELPVLPLQ